MSACQDCGRSMMFWGGLNFEMLHSGEFEGGPNIGVALLCTRCGRMWCSTCFLPRTHNSCTCNRAGKSVQVVNGVQYEGDLCPIRVRYDETGAELR